MIPDETVAQLGAIFTSTLSNALEDVGEDGVIMGLSPVAPGIRMAGRAMCVAQMTGATGTFDSSEFKVGAMIDAASAGDVVVVANNGNPVSSWGGTASYAAKMKGVAGLLVDGGVRDREEMIEHGFPVFARHMVPTTGRTRIRVTDIGGDVVISGQKVATGDIIVADGTGIVSIPVVQANEVLKIALALQSDDEQATREIMDGLTFSEAMTKFRKIWARHHCLRHSAQPPLGQLRESSAIRRKAVVKQKPQARFSRKGYSAAHYPHYEPER